MHDPSPWHDLPLNNSNTMIHHHGMIYQRTKVEKNLTNQSTLISHSVKNQLREHLKPKYMIQEFLLPEIPDITIK